MSFQGNINLRKAGDRIEMSDYQLSEYQKCMDDPVYFCENYVNIINLDSESLVLFKLRPFQAELLHSILQNRYTLGRLARQSGKSVLVSAAILWLTLFTKNYRTLIVAHKHDKAREVLQVIQKMYEFIPQWLQQGINQYNKGSMELENGSVIKTTGTSGSSGRGGSWNFLYIDEAAFIPTHIAEEFFKSVIPTISSGKDTKIVITSTPKGLNHFYKMYKDAEEGRNEYHLININWWDVPGRDEAWKKKIIDAYGEDYFRQEFNSEFLGSSDTLISGEKLKALVYSKPLITTNNTSVYAEPQKGRLYAITVDISEGIGLDYSVAICFDITKTPYEVVCIYRTNTTTSMQMPGVIYKMGRHYNDAMVLIETASEGSQVANILHYDMEYPHVISTSTAKSEQKISGGFGDKSRFGLKMTVGVKAVGCSILKTLIENDRLIINDYTLLQEFYHFTKQGKSFAADEGHDDHVMCCVSFAWLVDQGYIRDLSNVDLRQQVALDYQKQLNDSCAPLMIQSHDDHIEQEIVVASQGNWLFPNEIPPSIDSNVQELLDKYYK